MIIEPQFQLASENFSLIDISKMQAVKMVQGKPEGHVKIFTFVLFGIGVRLVFGAEPHSRYRQDINKPPK